MTCKDCEMKSHNESFGDLISRIQAEHSKNLKLLSKPIKYSNQNCVKCARLRVELYENGHLICEKCDWNHSTSEYKE